MTPLQYDYKAWNGDSADSPLMGSSCLGLSAAPPEKRQRPKFFLMRGWPTVNVTDLRTVIISQVRYVALMDRL